MSYLEIWMQIKLLINILQKQYLIDQKLYNSKNQNKNEFKEFRTQMIKFLGVKVLQ